MLLYDLMKIMCMKRIFHPFSKYCVIKTSTRPIQLCVWRINGAFKSCVYAIKCVYNIMIYLTYKETIKGECVLKWIV